MVAGNTIATTLDDDPQGNASPVREKNAAMSPTVRYLLRRLGLYLITL
jgi:hypothetical protein